jgi:hypothetical protein
MRYFTFFPKSVGYLDQLCVKRSRATHGCGYQIRQHSASDTNLSKHSAGYRVSGSPGPLVRSSALWEEEELFKAALVSASA